MNLAGHTGAHWRVDLPADWARRPDRDGVAYFEADDQRSGLYLATWDIHTTDRAPADVLDEFARHAVDALTDMPGHRWTHRTIPLGDGDVLVESVDAERHYRVLTRIIAGLPLVLRASFHDYAFTDVDESNARLGPMLQAVWLT